MTTPQPAALPELPKLPRCDFPNMQYQRRYVGNLYTADQMRAYALATLQAQPAEVSDAEIDRAAQIIANDRGYGWPHIPESWKDEFRETARAILALRPQAVPMTEDAQRQWRFIRDRLNTISMYQDSVGKFVEWFEAHHGVTATAGGEVDRG